MTAPRRRLPALCTAATAAVLVAFLPAAGAVHAHESGRDQAGARSDSGTGAATFPTAGAGTGTTFGSSNYREPGQSSAEAMRQRTARYGKAHAVRVFFPALPAGWDYIEDAYGDTPVVVSFKAAPQAVLRGDHDQQLARWFAAAPRDRVTHWVFWHEPEDDIGAGQFTAAQYRAGWTRTAKLAAQAGKRRSCAPPWC